MANPAPLSPFILVEPAFRLSLLWWEMYWAAAETIGYRLGAMALAGARPNAVQRRENARMVTEKMQVGLESAQALTPPQVNLLMPWWQLWQPVLDANLQLMQNMQRAWMPGTDWALGSARQWQQSAEKALRPWHRESTSNARRLRLRRKYR